MAHTPDGAALTRDRVLARLGYTTVRVRAELVVGDLQQAVALIAAAMATR